MKIQMQQSTEFRRTSRSKFFEILKVFSQVHYPNDTRLGELPCFESFHWSGVNLTTLNIDRFLSHTEEEFFFSLLTTPV